MIMHRLGKGQAKPPEEAGMPKPFHHNHHAGNEHNGRPVDSCRSTLLSAVPEAFYKKRLQIQRINNCLRALQTDAENHNQHQKSAHQCDPLALKLVQDDQHKHTHKNNQSRCLSNHEYRLLFSIHLLIF